MTFSTTFIIIFVLAMLASIAIIGVGFVFLAGWVIKSAINYFLGRGLNL